MFDEFMAYLRQEDRSDPTIAGYIQDLVQFKLWFERDTGEALNGKSISGMDVIAYRKHMVDERLGTATINRRLSAIRCWLRWCGNAEVVRVRNVRTTQSMAPKGLDRRQVAALLRAARRNQNAKRNVALITFMVETGLRVDEVANVRLVDVTINERSGSVRVAAGKGLKERLVPLNAGARRALNEWLAIRPQHFGEYLFTSQKGGPLSRNAIQRIVTQLSADAELKDVSAHTLRHTFASNYLGETGNLVRLARLLGHRNLNTTMRYVQPTQEQLADDLEQACLTE